MALGCYFMTALNFKVNLLCKTHNKNIFSVNKYVNQKQCTYIFGLIGFYKENILHIRPNLIDINTDKTC